MSTIRRTSIILFLLLLAACAPEEPEATQVPIARVTNTAVSPTTTSPPETPLPTSAVRPDTLTPTFTAVPTQPPTTIPLPLPTLTPFPTITPNYTLYFGSPDTFSRSIFLQLSSYGGDGAVSELQTPSIIIYSDGQFLFEDSDQYWEGQLTALEMCTLRQQIRATGFLEPHTEEEYFTQPLIGEGAGYVTVLVEDILYLFYYPNIPYLIEDLARGLNLIQNYRPPDPMTPYIPTAYDITIFEDMYEDEGVPEWPSYLPPLNDLWPDRSKTGSIVLEGETAALYHDLIISKITRSGNIWDNGKYYRVYSRPILPHETPHHQAYFTRPPQTYIAAVNCENEPAFIPTAAQTPLPSLPALSGQGRIAFVSQDHFQRSQEIFISEADGTNQFQLTNNQDFDGEPSWSPDGQKIAFTSDRNGNMDIFVMDINGRNVIQLTSHEADDLSPTWSLDGTKIAFTARRSGGLDNTEIYLINPDGTGEQQLTTNQIREHHPVFSPNGRQIAFVLEESLGNEKLAIFTLATSQVDILITDLYQSLSRPAWSPDGTQLAVAVDRNNRDTEIRIYNIATGQLDQQITLPAHQFPNTLSWTPTGSHLIFDAWVQTEGNLTNLSESTAHLGSYNLYALDTTTNQIIQITYNQQDETSPSWWP